MTEEITERKDYEAKVPASLRNEPTEFIRSITRPIISIIFAAVIAQVITQQIPISEWQWAVLVIPILWWFGDRTYHRVKDLSNCFIKFTVD